MTKIAIIMPVYNGAQYLDECINSILNQSFNDFELICVNDSSTDNSLEILNKYASMDSRVKVLTKQNEGPGLALNYGINNSESEYLCFIDQDDKYTKDYLKLMYQTISGYGIDLVMCHTYCWYPDISDKMEDANYAKFSDNCINIDSIKSKNKLTDTYFPQWAKIIKRTFFQNANIKFPDRNNNVHDLPVHYELIFNAKEVAFVNAPIYIHRIHQEQISYHLKQTPGYLKSYSDLLVYSKQLDKKSKIKFLKFIRTLIKDSLNESANINTVIKYLKELYSRKYYQEIISVLIMSLLSYNKILSVCTSWKKIIFRIFGIRITIKKKNNSSTSIAFNKNIKLKKVNLKTVGKQTYYSQNLTIVSPKTTIGSFCSIGNDVVLGHGNHPQQYLSTSPYFYLSNLNFKSPDQPTHQEFWIVDPISIGNDVWIGDNVFIKNGVKVGNGAIIGAKSVVTKDVEPYSIVVGSPAKHIRYRFDENTIKELEHLKWWELSDEQIKKIPYENVEKSIEYLKNLKN